MGYLITQILVCLLVAAIIGAIIGWLLRAISCRNREQELEKSWTRRMGSLELERNQLRSRVSELEGRLSRGEADDSATRLVVEDSSGRGGVDSGSDLASDSASVGNSTVNISQFRDSHEDDSDDNITIVSDAAPSSVDADVEANGSYDVEEIEGIGKGLGKRLRNMNIGTTGALMQKCKTADGVKEIAQNLSVEEFVVRQWNSMADLMRIPGVRSQFSELLEAAGISSVEELARQDAQQLATKMAQLNETLHLTRVVPSSDSVVEWVESARKIQA